MHFFTITFRNSFVYRFSVVFSTIGSILFIAINLMLWRYLYRDVPDMVSYMTKYVIIANITTMIYPRGIAFKIGEKILTGDFVIDLVKPINMFTMAWQKEIAEIASSFLLRGLPIVLIYMPFIVTGSSYYNLPYVVLAIALSHLLFLLIYSLIGFSAYILIEIWHFNRFLDDTVRLLSGGFIPLAILPGFIKSIAMILPFRFLYSFPLELLFGKIDDSKILMNFIWMIMWLCIFGILNVFLYRQALKKAVVQGG